MTSIAMIITGKIANSETLALVDSSIEPPISRRYAGRQRAAQVLEVGPDAARHVGGLHAVTNVGADRHGEVAVAAPEDRILVALLDVGDLCERDRDAVPRQDGEVSDRAEFVTLALCRAGDHDDLLGSVAHCRDRIARDERLQALRHGLRVRPRARARSWSRTSLTEGTCPSQSSWASTVSRLARTMLRTW
jgi:hypothetical protein